MYLSPFIRRPSSILFTFFRFQILIDFTQRRVAGNMEQAAAVAVHVLRGQLPVVLLSQQHPPPAHCALEIPLWLHCPCPHRAFIAPS
mmetsp:Transcript_20002/g.22521  ORF Transcript_20002/g.22521 Transcript_20002/m.22521 type:complete len:87 (-) Transcript_20002:1026-1286(-)